MHSLCGYRLLLHHCLFPQACSSCILLNDAPFLAGHSTEYNFTMLSERFQTEQQELETKIRELQEALSSMEQTESDAEKWVELIKQYSNPTELTTELLNSLIEKIVVHEAVKSPDGCRKQKVDIYYRFIGKID